VTTWPPPGSGTTPGPVRLWTATRDGQVATCDAVRVEGGLDLVIEVGGRQACRAPVRDALAAEWWDTFTAAGWQAALVPEVEH
jgi:hypothetical protein